MDKKKFFNIAKLVLKIAFSGILIYIVLKKIDYQQLRDIFLKSEPSYLLLAAITYFCSQLVSSWRLQGFLNTINLRLPFIMNLRLYLLGMFYNNFLPGGIGGDAFKIYLLNKNYGIPARKLFLTLFFDRLSGLWAIGMLIAILAIFIPELSGWKWIPFMVMLIGTAIYYIIVYFYFKTYAGYFPAGHIKSIVLQCMQLLSVFFILKSQHFTGDPSPYLFVFLISTIATVMPVSIGGLGIREYVMIKAVPLLHIDGAVGVFITLTFYILSLLSSLPGVWYVYHPKVFRKPGEVTPELN